LSKDRDHKALHSKYTIISARKASVFTHFVKNIVFSHSYLVFCLLLRSIFNELQNLRNIFIQAKNRQIQNCLRRRQTKSNTAIFAKYRHIQKVLHCAGRVFEIALRNAINMHYRTHFSDKEWIVNRINSQFFEAQSVVSINKQKNKLMDANTYSHDRLIAAMSLGFWTRMFFKYQYGKGNKTLLQIFPNKEKGTDRKTVAEELDKVRFFRNKIAHYESVCFDKQGEVSLSHAQDILELIIKYTQFLGVPNEILQLSELAELKKLLSQPIFSEDLS